MPPLDACLSSKRTSWPAGSIASWSISEPVASGAGQPFARARLVNSPSARLDLGKVPANFVKAAQHPFAVERCPGQIDPGPLFLNTTLVENKRRRHFYAEQVTGEFLTETRFTQAPASEEIPGAGLGPVGGMGRQAHPAIGWLGDRDQSGQPPVNVDLVLGPKMDVVIVPTHYHAGKFGDGRQEAVRVQQFQQFKGRGPVVNGRGTLS